MGKNKPNKTQNYSTTTGSTYSCEMCKISQALTSKPARGLPFGAQPYQLEPKDEAVG
uniref:Uncharacterized protein n=1 Tax=Manihot esculenta TaxID=3983 RepID=A0A2C9V9Q1_MANES